MYYVSAQGAGERMINVHYYYYIRGLGVLADFNMLKYSPSLVLAGISVL